MRELIKKIIDFVKIQKNLYIGVLTAATILCSISLNGQSIAIDYVNLPGIEFTTSGGSGDLSFYTGTSKAAGEGAYFEIKVGTSGATSQGNNKAQLCFNFTTTVSTELNDWEVVQTRPSNGKGSWASGFSSYNKSGTEEESYFVRNIKQNTAGSFYATLTIGSYVGSAPSAATMTSYCTINLTAIKVSGNVYRWFPTVLNDSFIANANNWVPAWSTKSNADVLIVDLALADPLPLTLDFDDASLSTYTIDRLIIAPNNLVTLKHSANLTTSDMNLNMNGVTNGQNNSYGIEIDPTAKLRVEAISNTSINLNLASGVSGEILGDLESVSGNINIKLLDGGTLYIGNLRTSGGALNFTTSDASPTTSPAEGIINFNTNNTSLSGSGALYIDSTIEVQIGSGSTMSFTLSRTLPLISNLTLLDNATLISNSPNSYSSSSDINAWTPYLQFNSIDIPNSKAYGQLINVGTNASITGGAQFNFYNNDVRSYRALGAPLSNGWILPQLADDIDLTGSVTDPTNANEFTTSCVGCGASVYYWDEPTQSWTGYTSGSTVTTIPLGTGVLAFYRGSKGTGLGNSDAAVNGTFIDLKGQVAYGAQNITITKTGTNQFSGYNLISNPYACNIDMRSLWLANISGGLEKIKPQFLFYDAITKSYNFYDSTSQTVDFSGKGNGKISREMKLVAPGASFFVIYGNVGGTSTTLTFDETIKEKVYKSGTKHFCKGVEEETLSQCNTLQGKLRYQNSENTESDEFKIKINNLECESDLDYYDLPKFYAGNLGIGTITDNNTWLTIDKRNKLVDIGQTKSIPLKVAYTKNGPSEMEIDIQTCEDFLNNYKIELFDKIKNSTTEISENTIYSFTASNEEEKKSDRFQLLFTGKANQSSVKTNQSNVFSVFPNPSDDGIIYIKKDQQTVTGKYEIYNYNGQLIESGDLSTINAINTIDLSKNNRGVYLLKIINDVETQIEKIIVK